VFEDIGVPRSGEALAKAEIASRIAAAIKRRALSQTEAAKLLDIDQADVSNLVRGKLRGFSTDRLLRFVVALGQDVEIVIHRRPHRGKLGSLRVLDDEPKRASAGGGGRKG
jgi:predicted XRE-type DNA-binding protein